MDINYYKKINGMYGTTSKREADIRALKNHIASGFEDDLLSHPVIISGREQVLSITYTAKEQVSNIMAKPYETFSTGEVVVFDDEEYLIIGTDPDKSIYTKGTMKRCVGQLKWYDSDGDLHSRHFAMKTDPATNFGTEYDRYMSLGDERRSIYLSFDIETKDLRKGKRFIFDSRAWKIAAIDTKTIVGLSIVTLQEDEINEAIDNLDLEIADYYNRNQPTIPPVVENEYSIAINGVDKITKGRQSSYEAVVTLDDLIENTLDVQWEIVSEDEITPSNLASIISIGANEIIIKASDNVGSYFKLKSSLVDYPDTHSFKKIQIKSLY